MPPAGVICKYRAMPLILKQQEPLLAVWKMDESISELLAELPDAPSYAAVGKVMHCEARLKERLTALLLVKELLGHEAEVTHTGSGAPLLVGEDWHISISHTKGYAAVVLERERAAGIDIEYVSTRVVKIRNRFLTPEENRNIDTANEAAHLLVHWCAKETLFKLIGEEDVDFREHLHVCPFPFRHDGTLEVWESRTGRSLRFKLAYQVNKDYVLTYRVD